MSSIDIPSCSSSMVTRNCKAPAGPRPVQRRPATAGQVVSWATAKSLTSPALSRSPPTVQVTASPRLNKDGHQPRQEHLVCGLDIDIVHDSSANTLLISWLSVVNERPLYVSHVAKNNKTLDGTLTPRPWRDEFFYITEEAILKGDVKSQACRAEKQDCKHFR